MPDEKCALLLPVSADAPPDRHRQRKGPAFRRGRAGPDVQEK